MVHVVEQLPVQDELQPPVQVPSQLSLQALVHVPPHPPGGEQLERLRPSRANEVRTVAALLKK